MEGRYNTRSPAVKRLMREAQELSEATDQYFAQPLEDNLFEWHFTVRGPADSDFQNGIYHGRIILPMDYPMKPPSIIWLTPNGRFETNKKICLSISGHHPESWQPSWSIRTALLAIIGFMPTRPGGAIGSLDYTPEERKTLAKKSQDWKCPSCGSINHILHERKPTDSSPQASQEAKELAAQIQFEGEKKATDGQASSANTPAQIPTTATSSSSSSGATPSPTEEQRLQKGVSEGDQAQTHDPARVQLNISSVSPPWNLSQPYAMPGGPGMPQFSPNLYWPGTPPDASVGSPMGMLPRFPLPPSQQPGGMLPMQYLYPPGFAPLPQGVGAFPNVPFQFPGFPQGLATVPTVPVSVNNSSSISGQTTVHPPAVDASVENISSQSVQQSGNEENCDSVQQAQVTKNVTDVDPLKSDSKSELTSEGDNKDRAQAAGMTKDTRGKDSKGSPEPVEGIASMDNTDDPNNLKAGDTIIEDGSDVLGAEGHDSSESGIPPIEVSETEQRSSHLERSISSSVPDLEKQSKGTHNKGLRYRQSTTAAVPTPNTDNEEEQRARAEVGTGQRIEAASGDSYPRVLRGGTQRAFAEARMTHRNNLARSTQLRDDEGASQYDASFFAMVALSLATVFILLNRLILNIDWSFMI